MLKTRRMLVVAALAATAVAGVAGPLAVADDKPAPGIEVADIFVREDAGVAKFIVRLHDGPESAVTTKFQTVDGTAKAPGDYRATAGSLTFAPGEAEKVVEVVLANDRFGEPSEILGLVLSEISEGITHVKPTAVARIANDDPGCLVPSVAGKTRSEARVLLRANNCRLGRTIKRYSTRARNRIVKQSPPAGLEVYGLQRVTVVVSKGPRPKKRAPKAKAAAS